jgi:hypothetical protein
MQDPATDVEAFRQRIEGYINALVTPLCYPNGGLASQVLSTVSNRREHEAYYACTRLGFFALNKFFRPKP